MRPDDGRPAEPTVELIFDLDVGPRLFHAIVFDRLRCAD
jgi:hypothetical protein